MTEDPEIERGRQQRAEERERRRQRLAEAIAARGDALDSEAGKNFAAACTGLGPLSTGNNLFLFVLFGWVGTVLSVFALERLVGSPVDPVLGRSDPFLYWGPKIWPLFPAILGVAIAAYVIARVAGSRAAAREGAWLGALPFQVDGIFDSFGSGIWRSELAVELWFTGDLAKDELARLLEFFAPEAKVREETDSLRFKVAHAGQFSWIWSLTHTRRPFHEHWVSNRALLYLFHDLVADVLAPLHEKCPIAMVKLSSS